MDKAIITKLLEAITDSRCRRRVGRNHGCSIQAEKVRVGHLTLLGGLRRIRGLRQAGVLIPSVVLFFANSKFYWVKSL